MALSKRINPFLKNNNDTGFGTSATSYGGRFVNKDGSFNLRKEGIPIWDRISVFHKMLNMPRWKFILVIILSFVVINLLFTFVYLVTGVDEFTGIIVTSEWSILKELYFFSTETFSTVGYGRVNPVGSMANLVASFEALTGSLFFAIVTGLIYGRFSKPKSFLVFSNLALVAPFQGGTGLMFRFVSYKENHNLTSVEVTVSLSIVVIENGKSEYKFYTLPLERSRVDSLPMNFTVVHPIDENSPIYGFTFEDMQNADMELYVLIKAFDDVYSSTVLQRTSYTYDEIKFNAKFVQMYRESEDGMTTIIEMNKLNEFREV